MTKLYLHLDYVKYFTIRETLYTMIGYYHTLLEGALNFILKIKMNIYSYSFLGIIYL